MILRHRSSATVFTLLAVSLMIGSTGAAPFVEGNLAIYRVGNGVDAVTNAPAAVFIDEYTPTGSFVQSIAMPTASSGATRALTAQGNATLEGLINRSTDGQYLVLTGYDHNLGDLVPSVPGNGTLAQTTAAQVPRTIGRIDVSGNVNTTTTYNDSGQGSPRSVISDNGTNLWISQGSISGGTDGGVRFTTLGSTGASTSISQDSTDTRNIDIFGGQLYVSSFTTSGLMSVDENAGTMTGLANISTTDRVQFFMADLSSEIAGIDTAYVADMRAQGDNGGLYKFALNSEGTWVASGSIAGAQPGGEPAVSVLRGLTGEVDELGTVTLYGTRNAAAGAQLLKFVDNTGYAGTLSGTADLLVTASGKLFKGVDFTPVVAPAGQPGDHNQDGVVDAADYVAWRKLNIDGQNGYDDFVENFGEPGSGGSQQAATGVPEPSALGLIAIAAMIIVLGSIRPHRTEFAFVGAPHEL